MEKLKIILAMPDDVPGSVITLHNRIHLSDREITTRTGTWSHPVDGGVHIVEVEFLHYGLIIRGGGWFNETIRGLDNPADIKVNTLIHGVCRSEQQRIGEILDHIQAYSSEHGRQREQARIGEFLRGFVNTY
jgi:hypothetical protein